jgi:hypothetical protein
VLRLNCVITSPAESGIIKQKLGDIAALNAQLVAKLGSLILLEYQSAGSVHLIAAVDSHLFHLAQCEEVRFNDLLKKTLLTFK